MRFCDEAKVFVESGAGGAGSKSFRREKNIPFGGPDGGHGGDGGHVYFRACPNLMTLADFHFRQHFRAGKGENGSGRNQAGKRGEDMVVLVPVGTQIWDETMLLGELLVPEETLLLLKGGIGGAGNAAFASSTNRTPEQFGPGTPGQSLWVKLRLKLLATIGFIGFPNAGKSTLLQSLTNSRTKVGDYPFTTLSPQLGLWITGDYGEMILADLPGLIKDAHVGKGLGHQFLRHAEGCEALLHMIDGSEEETSIQERYALIREELYAYGKGLAEKKEYIVITKADGMTGAQRHEASLHFPKALLVSAHSGEGIGSLTGLLDAHHKGKDSS